MFRFIALLLPLILASSVVCQSRKTWEFQDVCGNPEVESQSTVKRAGIVTRVLDGDTVEFKEKRNGKIWTVELAGVEAIAGNDLAEIHLRKTILNKKVTVWGNADREKDPVLEARIFRKNTFINRILMEEGMATYRGTDYGYAVSNYSLCVLSKLEEKAKREKRGAWAKP